MVKSIKLFQNYPNPFNPSTNITFTIADRTKVTLTIYNILGQIIKILVDEEKNPGEYKINFKREEYSIRNIYISINNFGKYIK